MEVAYAQLRNIILMAAFIMVNYLMKKITKDE
jgi:hypothetical protein